MRDQHDPMPDSPRDAFNASSIECFRLNKEGGSTRQDPARKPPARGGTRQAITSYRAPAWNDNVFDGDDGDDDEQQSNIEMARSLLPRSGEVAVALDVIQSLDYESLATAGTLNNEFRHTLPDEQVDSMVAAVLLFGASNTEDIITKFSMRTMHIFNDFVELFGRVYGENEEGVAIDDPPYQDFSRDSRRVFMTQQAVLMQLSLENVRVGAPLPLGFDLGVTSQMIIRESLANAKQPHPGDIALQRKMISCFNEIAHLTHSPLRLAVENRVAMLRPAKKNDGPSPTLDA